MESVVTVLSLAFGIGFLFWFYIRLPASMALHRGRAPVIWVLIGLVGSPLLAILLLLALGAAQGGESG